MPQFFVVDCVVGDAKRFSPTECTAKALVY